MSFRPLMPDSEKDKHKSREQLLEELSTLRARLEAESGSLEACERVAGMIGGITEPVVVVDDCETILYANAAASQTFGGSQVSLAGRCFWDLYPKNADTLFCNVYEKAKKSRTPARFRDRSRRLGKLFEVFIYPVPGGRTLVFRDSTADRQKEEIARLGLVLLHNMKESIFLMRADGRLFHVNDETKNSLGYSGAELHKMSIFDVVPPDCQQAWRDILDRIRHQGSMTFESRIRARDGLEFPVEVYANYIEIYGNNYYTISARDITERERAEEALRQKEASLARAQEIAHLGNWEVDIGTNTVQGSEELYRMFNLESGVPLTLDAYVEKMHPGDRNRVVESINAAISEGKPYDIDYRIIPRPGDVYYVHAEGQVTHDENGLPITFFGTVQDITERVKTERVLEKYRLFSENARDIALFIRQDGKILEANQAAVRAYGYTHKELLSLSIYDLRSGELGDHIDRQMDKAFDTGLLFEALHRRKDGSTFPAEVSSQGRIIDGEKVLLSVVRDITVRKRMEEALIDAEDFNRSVLDSLPSNIAVLDQTGTILYVNDGWKKFGMENAGSLKCAKGVGINYFDVCRNACGPHSAESPAALKGMMSVLSGENNLFEMEYPCDSPDTRRWFQMRVTPFSGRKTHGIVVYHNDITARKMAEEVLSESEAEQARAQKISHIGSWTWDLITDEINWSDESYRNYGLIPGEVKPSYELFLSFIVPEDRERVDHVLRRAIDTGEKCNVICTIIRKDGVPRLVLSELEIITDGSGKAIKMYGTNQDITDRKHAEEALQAAKAQAELYVDLMGHDINNMNQVAMASLEMALMDLEQDGKLDTSGIPLLERSLESLNNSSALIRNVQKLQRASVEGIRLQAVDVADVLKGIIDEQRSTHGKDVIIYYKNEATHCLVTANELLRDVFTNIIGNAIKHARTDRHLTIGVAVESVTAGGKKFCRVSIDDNGSGIPDEVKGRLFRRFSRGETKAKGSGLGLYLVKTLVEHYGGDIRVENRIPGDHTKGAKFIVTIPSAESL